MFLILTHLICGNICILVSYIACEWYGFIGGLSGTVAIMTIAAMAVERYITICYPFDSKSYVTKRSAIGVSIFLWIYSLLFAAPPIFHMYGLRYVPEGYLTSCTFNYISKNIEDRVFVFVFFCAAYVVPMIAIGYSYTAILITVRKSGKFVMYILKDTN